MASSSTPSPSTTTLTKKYEVFLSFRGLDTRQGFTSHLYDALCRKNIKTFRDDDELRRGVEISPALLRAIEESKIAVVIFSKNYASSEWCLSELAEIIKRMKLKELIVMPVFYHVATDDVQELKGSYDCSFANEAGFANEEVQKWREALKKASNQTGFDSSVIRPEAKLVRQIVKAVWRELRSEYIPSSSDFKGLVGILERIDQVKELLCLEIEDVRIIGIWGMGGVGKTTIARAVFKSISYQFDDGACIIEKVGKILEETGGSDRLERYVVSKVLHDENLKLDTPIRPDIMGMLNQKKVFIVLDDVETTQMHKISTLKTFVERLVNQCGLGSRIIITSRDKDKLCTDDRMIHKVEGFNFDEALELFHKHANPTEDCMALSEEIVHYAGGNPLALEVLGLHFMGKKKHLWKSALKKLQGIVNSRIFNVLKISYDGLDDDAKNLFLDIACFKDFYDYQGLLKEEFLDGLDDSLSDLDDKSLITRHIITGRIEMHDLLQEMGRKIVCGESPKNPGERSRLWERNDVIETLEKNTGTDAVEVISLDMGGIEDEDTDTDGVEDEDTDTDTDGVEDEDTDTDTDGVEDENMDGPKVIHLSPQVFDNMRKLRFLLFHSRGGSNKVHLSEGLNCLPDELMILHWPGYPLTTLPSNFNPKKLIKLDLSRSNIEQFWEETKQAPTFPKLKWLILHYCKRLTRIPNLSYFPSLVKLKLSRCKSLIDFTSSVQQHNNLRNLNLSYSNNVNKIPLILRKIETLNLSATAIKEVPSSIEHLNGLRSLTLHGCQSLEHISPNICKLKSLSTLDLRYCSQLKTFPKISETMESLKSLKLCGTKDLKELPPSIEHLNGLRSLTLQGCDKLKELPSSICNLTSLKDLDLSYCKSLYKLPDNLGNLKSLKKLRVSGLPIGKLPSSITCLENLKDLDCYECRALTRLPPLSGLRSLRTLRLNNCRLMEILEDIGCLSSLELLKLSGNMFKSLPKSIKQLSKLHFLYLNHCNMLQSIPEFPESLIWLEATDCDQLCEVPDASAFVRCINSLISSKSYCREEFIFTYSLNLIKAVSDVFEESLRIMQSTEKESGKPSNKFCFYLSGNEIPKWFRHQNLESSVNIQVSRNDWVNRKFMGFAICAVFGFAISVNCDFEAYCDCIKIFNGSQYYPTGYRPNCPFKSFPPDHMLLGYCSFYSSLRNPKKLPAGDGDSDHVDISIKFKINDNCNQPKCWAVHPIYAEEPSEITGANIQEIGETSGRRSDQSNDNDEEVEPHPKRNCTHAIKTLDLFH